MFKDYTNDVNSIKRELIELKEKLFSLSKQLEKTESNILLQVGNLEMTLNAISDEINDIRYAKKITDVRYIRNGKRHEDDLIILIDWLIKKIPDITNQQIHNELFGILGCNDEFGLELHAWSSDEDVKKFKEYVQQSEEEWLPKIEKRREWLKEFDKE